MDVHTHDVTEEQRAAYRHAKEEAFADHHTESAIVGALSEFAATACAARSIPTVSRLFGAHEHDIHRTTLAVDGYLTDRLMGLVDTTNTIAEAFHRAD